jgi:hypothetical protein
MTSGVRILLNDEEIKGYIIRRLNSDSYLVWLDDGREMNLSPKDFIEVEN